MAKANDKVRDLDEQMAALQSQPGGLDDEQAKDIQAQLATAHRDLIFARRNAEIAADGGVSRVASASTGGNAYTIDGASPGEVANLRAQQRQSATAQADSPSVTATKVYDGPIGDAQQASSTSAPPIHFNAPRSGGLLRQRLRGAGRQVERLGRGPFDRARRTRWRRPTASASSAAPAAITSCSPGSPWA